MADENMCPLAEKPCAVVWLYAMTRQIVAFHLRWPQSPVSQRCQMKFSKSFQWLSDGDINELISSLFRLVVRGSMIWRVHAPLADRFWILLCSARVRSLIPRVI